MAHSNQGGVKNYLGNQKMVKAPLHWQSAPNHPTTELAYITKKEKDLLLKKDLHKSLKGGVNRGPSGIISLNGWGDTGEGFADKSYGGNERRGRDVQVTTGSPHTEAPQTVTRRTKTVSPKDHFEQSWSGPERFFGLTGGYKDLKTPGDTSQGHQSRLGGLGQGLLSLLGGVPGKVLGALSQFKGSGTLADWWRSRQAPVEEEEFESDYKLTPDGYQYVGESMDDTMKEFRQKYPLELGNNAGFISDYPAYRTPNLGGTYHYPTSYADQTKNSLAIPSIYAGDNEFINWDHGAKDGGRIGYKRGRVVNPGGYAGEEEFEDENTLEFMRDQGVPHSEMAEGPSPFDIRVQELVDEGMSWQQAWSIASQEFGLLAEGEDSFSDQGLASLV